MQLPQQELDVCREPVLEHLVVPTQLPTEQRRGGTDLLMPQRPVPSVPQFAFKRPQLSPQERRQMDFGVQIFCPLLPQQQPIPLGDRPSDYSSTSPNPVARCVPGDDDMTVNTCRRGTMSACSVLSD